MTAAGRRGVVLGAALTQIAGVLGFVFAPEAVFALIPDDALARFCLRLAAYAHLSFATLTFAIAARCGVATLRAIAAAAALYHTLAGIEGVRAALGAAPGVVLAAPEWGPAGFHTVMTALLVAAAAWPERGRESEPGTPRVDR